jgi:hypothetical protein
LRRRPVVSIGLSRKLVLSSKYYPVIIFIVHVSIYSASLTM